MQVWLERVRVRVGGASGVGETARRGDGSGGRHASGIEVERESSTAMHEEGLLEGG